MNIPDRLAELYNQIHDLQAKNGAMPESLCQEFIELTAEKLTEDGKYIRKRQFKKVDRW